MNETWKVINGFPDYAVSDKGRVKRITPTKNNHKKQRIHRLTGSGKNPLLKVTLHSPEGIRKCFAVSRLVLLNFIGPPPEGKDQGNHIDGNRKNNWVENLEWVSCKENIQHALRTGLRKNQAVGERCARSKLTSKKVYEIKSLLATGVLDQVSIARRFNIAPCSVWDIKKGKTWKHL